MNVLQERGRSTISCVPEKSLVDRRKKLGKGLRGLRKQGRGRGFSAFRQFLMNKLKTSLFGPIEKGTCVVGGDPFTFRDFFVWKAIDIVHDQDPLVAFSDLIEGREKSFFHLHELEHVFWRTLRQREIFDLTEALVLSFFEAIKGLVDRDPQDPRPKPSPLRIKSLDVLEGPKHRLLGDFFGIGRIIEVASDEMKDVAIKVQFGDQQGVRSDTPAGLNLLEEKRLLFSIHQRPRFDKKERATEDTLSNHTRNTATLQKLYIKLTFFFTTRKESKGNQRNLAFVVARRRKRDRRRLAWRRRKTKRGTRE